MGKTLGIDTGTNSLGWAIVDKSQAEYRLLDKGVCIFEEGVKLEKGNEKSRAAERTAKRSIRIQYYRRRLRKIRLLRVLCDNHLCPPLSSADLSQWRLKKIYPESELFMKWQATDDKEGENPYYYRHLCLNKKLDLEDITNRYVLGRALYHLNQRRGFLSNRKSQDNDEDGKVKGGISTLSHEMKEAGYEYIGDYFYSLYTKGCKIRNHYTARNKHYLKEFRAICTKQELSQELTDELERIIFFQRPLKSAKGQVGNCIFEKNKARCPVSHPMFEEFRMLSLINNIKIKTPKDNDFRRLNEEERKTAISLFYNYRKSKPEFNFEEIAKKIAGKGNYGYFKDGAELPYLFNYRMDTSVPTCTVTAQLKKILGEDYVSAIREVYTLGTGKTALQVINDIWHALFFYSDTEKLACFGKERLQLNDDEAEAFSKIQIPQGYASLSLKALTKILPYLRRGMIYSHAVFLANLGKVMPSYEWDNEVMREGAIENITRVMEEYNPKEEGRTLETCVKDYLKSMYGVTDEACELLYHPSMIETYPQVRPNEYGIYQLGSPRTSSIRNPMAMRSLFQLRKLVNSLLTEGKIDRDTTINIEFARELNDANKRIAIARFNREEQDKKDKARKEIKECYHKETGVNIEPTDRDILKYLLWEEQGHRCIYTGKQIRISDFISENPKFDIEHTIPQSAGGDSTKMNLTLCDASFNRNIKKTHLPSELGNYEDILQRIGDWKETYEKLDKQIRKLNTRGLSTKEAKDRIIQKRHLLELERNYWKGKYERFTMTEVPEGFSRRQGTDISVISKYARLFLKSVFPKVYIVKGIATSDFRKASGLQDIYSKKERVNHIHHCIDAVVIACIDKYQYDKLAQFYHDKDRHEFYGTPKAIFKKPWPTFVEDMKTLQEEVLIAHNTPDNMPKQGRRRIVIDNKKVLCKGDAARGSLHNDTYYGAIMRNDEIKYVIRKPLSELKETDIKNIVDDTVRGIIQKAIASSKNFKDAMESPIWMNEEKQIRINKVRLFAPSVTKPLKIRQQRDLSPKEYKQKFNVANDRNYMMAIYIGKDKAGKEKRDFKLINNIEAARFYKTSNNRRGGDNIVPQVSKNGYPLSYTLKIGTMVLLYEKNPDEIWNGDIKTMSKRLYKVVGMSLLRVSKNIYGRIVLNFHEEARKSTDFKPEDGAYKQDEEHRASIRMLHTQINALIEGYDFRLKETGEIERLR